LQIFLLPLPVAVLLFPRTGAAGVMLLRIGLAAVMWAAYIRGPGRGCRGVVVGAAVHPGSRGVAPDADQCLRGADEPRRRRFRASPGQERVARMWVAMDLG
jgi:hypothetical protein